MSKLGDRGRRRIVSITEGGYCNWCGMNSVRTDSYDDGVVEIECENCVRNHAYTVKHSGPQGCKTTFTPDK